MRIQRIKRHQKMTATTTMGLLPMKPPTPAPHHHTTVYNDKKTIKIKTNDKQEAPSSSTKIEYVCMSVCQTDEWMEGRTDAYSENRWLVC